MTDIQFVVPGVPVAKARARSFYRNGRFGHYTPEKTAEYEKSVRAMAKIAMGSRPPITGACGLLVVLHMPVPVSWSKSRREQALSGFIRPASKPDCSNVLKSIEDGMNGVIYRDDAQVTDVCVVKKYAGKPKAIVSVRELS